MAEPTTVSLYEAKTHLSDLGDRASRGEEIVVTKHGKPSFRMVAVAPQTARRGPGVFVERLSEAERAELENVDWFSPDEELERDFGMRE